jgi:hypothetical protein
VAVILGRSALAPSLVGAALAGCLWTSDLDGLATGGAASSSGGGGAGGASSSSGGGGGASSTGAGGDAGACCLGNVCEESGRCASITMHIGAVIGSLALDATRVYWTDPHLGEVLALSKAALPGDIPDALATAEDHAATIAVRGGLACWSTRDMEADTYALRCRASEGEEEPVTIATGDGSIVGLALDDTHAYFGVVLAATSATSVLRVPLAGGEFETLVAPDQHGLSSPALDQADPTDDRVYWARLEPEPEGGIFSIRKDKLPAEEPRTEVTGQARPLRLVVDDRALYWTNTEDDGATADRVMSAPVGGEATEIDASFETPWAIAKYEDTLAWTAIANVQNDGVVATKALPNGEVRVLADGQAWPGSVAIDERAVYWGNEYDGRLQKIGRCVCTPTE